VVDDKVEILFQTLAGYSNQTSAFTTANHAGFEVGEVHSRLTNPGGETDGVAVRNVLQNVSEFVKFGTPPTKSSVEIKTQMEVDVASTSE
jgi:hypothetical protein